MIHVRDREGVLTAKIPDTIKNRFGIEALENVYLRKFKASGNRTRFVAYEDCKLVSPDETTIMLWVGSTITFE